MLRDLVVRKRIDSDPHAHLVSDDEIAGVDGEVGDVVYVESLHSFNSRTDGLEADSIDGRAATGVGPNHEIDALPRLQSAERTEINAQLSQCRRIVGRGQPVHSVLGAASRVADGSLKAAAINGQLYCRPAGRPALVDCKRVTRDRNAPAAAS